MPSPFDAVLFDLDDTIVRYEQDGEDVLRATFESVGVDSFCDPEELSLAAEEVGEADSEIAFCTEMFGIAAERHGGDPEHAPALGRAYMGAIDHTQVRTRPGVEPTFSYLTDSDHRVGLVTNTGPENGETKMASVGVREHFETVVYAGEDHRPKPATDGIEAALSDLGVDPSASLYVGDKRAVDVDPAKELGMVAAWFPPAERAGGRDAEYTHEPDHRLERLDDLLELL